MASSLDQNKGLHATDTITTEQRQGVVGEDVLSLNLTDAGLNKTLDNQIQESRSYFKSTLKWWDMMAQHENVWLGKQIDMNEMYPWQLPYVDNAIFRDIETIIPIAVSKVPKPQATPAQNTPLSRKLATDIEKSLEYGFGPKREAMRSKIRMALRHLTLYKLGVLKALWDPNLFGIGDYRFKVVRPSRIYAIDHTTADPNELRLFVELVTETAKEAAAKFPGAKDDLYRELGILDGDNEDKVFTYQEAWFRYFEGGRTQIGVLWRYKHTILDKMKNPNWDHQGEDIKDEMGLPTGDKIFHNYFDEPKLPYIFLNYLNLGKQIVDDTSLIEQAWPLQQTANKRGMQITEMADKAQGKLAISTDYMTADEAELITDDPREHIVGNGPIRDGIIRLSGEQPGASLFEDKAHNLSEIDNMMGAHSTTRGERKESETLGGRVLLREGDFGRIDDLVQEAVEPAFSECFGWAVQLMKLRYTELHYARVTGKDGQFDQIALQRDSIEDGLEIFVQPGSSLPTDKLSKSSQALELASLNRLADDDLFERLGDDNPKETALKTSVFNNDKALYARILVSGKTFTEYLTEQFAQPPAPAPGQPGQPPQPGQPSQAGPPGQPGAPDATGGVAPQDAHAAADTLTRLRQFAQSPRFKALSPSQQQAVITEIKRYVQTVGGVVSQRQVNTQEINAASARQGQPIVGSPQAGQAVV